MPLNGSGTYSLPLDWAVDKTNGETIQADRMMTQEQDIADAISTAIFRDGQAAFTANQSMGGFKLTNVGDAAADTDALNRQTADARYPALVGSSTDNAIPRFDGTSGAMQNSGIVIDDTTFDIHPDTHDVGSLGIDAKRFSDLWLASGAVVTFGAASAADVTITHSADALAFAGAASGYTFDSTVTLTNTGLHLLDTNASHDLIVKPGSDLTADRTLTVTTGDADRTLDISAASVTVSAYGATLVDDADAATARATLEFETTTTDNAVPRFDGTTGATQNSGIIVDDSNNVSGAASVAISRSDTTAGLTVTSTDNSSSNWSAIIIHRDSSTPEASDFIGFLDFKGENANSDALTYTGLRARIDDQNTGSEDGALEVRTRIGGSLTTPATFGAGVTVGSPTGGDKGNGTLNADTLYEGGDALSAIYMPLNVAADLTTLSIASTGTGAFSVTIDNNENLTANRTLTLKLNDAARALDIDQDLILANGTWTPQVTFATPGNLSIAYSTQSGSYTRIGNLIIASFSLQTSTFTHTTASGDVQIGGLPFTVHATYLGSSGAIEWRGITKANYTDVAARPIASNTHMTLVISGSGQNAVAVQASDMPTGGTVRLYGVVFYRVS